MKKVIIAFDGKHFSKGAFSIAEYLNDHQPILLTGIFLSAVDYRDVIGVGAVGLGGPIFIPTLEKADEEAIKENIHHFEEICRKKGIEYRIHKDDELFALEELVKETRFADLLIISGENFYSNVGEKQPNDYMQRVLHKSECPVIIVPEAYEPPRFIILAYDGGEDSVYAIKQFAYLFPELCNKEVVLLYANHKEEDLPERDRMSELAARHFSNLTLQKADIADPRKSFHKWIGNKQNSILVSGSFARSGFSESIKKSFIFETIADHKVPVFVAHK
ncbi:MAG TPA: universal stress protein [Chitinophagaceae bacterium]|nr:universal stress protein [Chitinophagaceae bacterium]